MRGNGPLGPLLRVLVLTALAALPVGSAFSQPAEPGRDYAREFEEKYGVKQTPPTELVPVVQALDEHRPKDAIRLCRELIVRDERSFRNKTEASWIKSEAYRYQADATYRLNGDLREAIELLKPAADLGNLQADTKITETIWRKYEGDPDYASVEASPEELTKYLRIGAELGDPLSAAMLGASNSPATLAEPEKVYWSLIGFALAINDEPAYRRRMMAGVINRVGKEKVVTALEEYSLLPPTTAPGPGALPGRGLIATIYADATLRKDYAYSYGRRGTEGTRTGPTPTVLEVFKTLQAYANVARGIRAFLLVPGARRFEDPSLLSVPKNELASVIGPSDYVFLRCGELSHVATIHHVDRGQDRVYLSDGLWEYWQPSHNSCISRFELMPFQHGGFLVEVPLSEFTAIVEAVATLRDPPSS
jgi:hypothetical protein